MTDVTSPVKPELPGRGARSAAARSARRAERREAMVQAAIEAVRAHGPGVSVADIAAHAGITKPVLYRHFEDRADLQREVGRRAAEQLMERIAPALALDSRPAEQVSAVVDAFLAGIEEEPQLWRFVVHNPEPAGGAEIVEDVRSQIAVLLATLIGDRLRAAGLDSGGAEAWAYGLVGMVQSAGDWWLERRTMSRAALTGYLTTLIWAGMGGVLAAEVPAAASGPARSPGGPDVGGPVGSGTAEGDAAVVRLRRKGANGDSSA